MRKMTWRVRLLVRLSYLFPFHVMHVECARIGNRITDALYLFGKQVWVEKDLTHSTPMGYSSEPRDYAE